ncbi:MAG TPA: DUF4433 domain-containing protein [Acetobacteraceae bacterium]|nr:DUF4433 domain-containing protein [Acetobacteraceae bacterium]
MSESLTQGRALIFRIVHRDNVSWILANGMHCRNATIRDPHFMPIGNSDLIEKRHDRSVPCPPHGTLSDYVPFYFTPFTPMLLNIKTGFNGIRQRPIEEIVIFVSSLSKLRSQGVPFVFTDRHAYLATAQFSDDLADLGWIDWQILQRRDFKRDPENPGKFERYQAEALVYRHLRIDAMLGIMCYSDATRASVQSDAKACGCPLQVITRPGWYV